MSVEGCVKYICLERGIEPPKETKSRAIELDRKLEELRLAKLEESDDIELLGVNLLEAPRPRAPGSIRKMTEEQKRLLNLVGSMNKFIGQ